MMTTKSLDKYIFWCLCAFAAITCINHVIGNQILGLAVFLGMIRTAKECPVQTIPLEYKRALSVFLGVMFCSIFISPDMVKSAKEFWRYTNRMFPFLLVIFFVKDKKRLLYIFGAFLLSMLINNIYAVYKGVLAIWSGETYLRITGFESMLIMFAAYLLISLPILVVLYFENNKKWSRYIMAAIIIFLAALLVNGSRMAWLISAIILPLIVFIYVKDLKKLACIICISAVALGGLASTLPFMKERMMSFSDSENISNQGHSFIMNDSIAMIKDYPLFGVGLGRFQKVFNQDYRSKAHIELEGNLTPHAHNNILTFWAETGVFGVSAYIFMFGSFLYYSGKQWLKLRNASALMFFMITLATVLQGITDYSFGLNQAVKIYFCMLAIYLNYQIYEDNLSLKDSENSH